MGPEKSFPPNVLLDHKQLEKHATLLSIMRETSHTGRVNHGVSFLQVHVKKTESHTPFVFTPSPPPVTETTRLEKPVPFAYVGQTTGALSYKQTTQLRRVSALTSFVTPNLEMKYQ